jgi:hypothetical protein
MLDTSSQSRRAPMRDHRGDFYDTPPVAVEALLRHERLPHRIWEPAAGKGNIVQVLRQHGHEVIATDLNNRGCPDCLDRVDFLLPNAFPAFTGAGLTPQSFWQGALSADAIVTNPPYVLAEEFVATALERAPLVIMLMRLAFYESDRRSHILENCGLARIHVFRKRLPLMHRDGWQGKKANSGMAFCWMVWDRNHIGLTSIDRISWERS